MAEERQEHRMDIVCRGELEDITKPPSSSGRNGTKVSENGAPRPRQNIPAALEILPPERMISHVSICSRCTKSF